MTQKLFRSSFVGSCTQFFEVVTWQARNAWQVWNRWPAKFTETSAAAQSESDMYGPVLS